MAMSAMTASTSNFHPMDNVAQSPSPVSPTTFQNQQPNPSRSFINLNPSGRSQSNQLPSTPTSATHLEPPPGMAYSEYIRTWTDNHVARWLIDVKCGNHSNTFRANDIRGDVLLELDQITLKEMGVASIGDRLRIVNAVKVLRQKSAASMRSSTPISDGKRHGSFLNNEHGGSAGAGDHGNTSTQTIGDRSEGSPSSRLHSRRLEAGRPAPLQLNANSRNDLPRLVREGAPDSARISHSIRPLPQPAQGGPSSMSMGASGTNSNANNSSSNIRPNLPPLPPVPRTQPPNPPPNRAPARTTQMTGRRTPTGDPPPYALLPTPPNQGLLTPNAVQSNSWTGYGLPSDPRPSRVTSPLPPMRGPPRTPNSILAHGRNTSLSSPNSSTPTKLPPRPSTGNNSHPYAQSSAPGLQPPTQAQQAYNLSPIAESFMSQHASSGTPSPPTAAYTVGRGPFNRPITPSAPSLDDLRRKLVKFLLPDEGHSCTINVADCAGGIEVLEKVLKKFGKASSRDNAMEHVQTDEGGLSVDGWGVYLDWGQGDGPGEVLTEAELLSICHASPDNPAREHGLTLRRIGKAKRPKALQMLEPRQRHSPTTPDRDDGFVSSSHAEKNTKRASSISILSGLGVRDPERALEPASSPSTPDGKNSAKKPSKLRNFFGQRPPSELITTHLTEYFPFTEKKVLERTARHSLMRSGTILSRGESMMSGRRESMISRKRDSTISWNPPLPSRFSISTQGSQPRSSSSPTRTSFSSATPTIPDQTPNYADSIIAVEDIPRVSISAEDGRPIALQDNDDDYDGTKPQLLPPVTFPSESLAESMESLTGSRPVSRSMSNASKRMSFITELRSKRDRSDTASLMTVDEITAEVESRRESMALEDWTKVDSEDGDTEDQGTTLVEEEADEELFDDEEEATLSADDEGEPGKPITMKAAKWIKGALIGAGSFGKVYLGMDASSGLLMAVKQVELPTGSAPNEERKKSMLSALEREIELLKDLQHDNIVQYLYSSLDDDYLNIFLEYVPGGSVTALLSNYGAFEEPLVKNFVRQILDGLNYLHERDIIHRDIKGANILVDNKGGIKISDFGISKKVEGNLLAGNRLHRPSLQGSVFWMAPEVVKQIGHTRKADIWSVGCLVVEMLTGEHPWAQLTQMQAIFKIGSSAKPTIPSDISSEAQEFLQRTFELDHEARPSADELLQHNWISKKPAQSHKTKASPSAIELTA